ncbi:MAG: terminase small subunit [Alphaproteobacteria bacterium]|nr:terminase small subunit [Alphaproteobacteria bacterium]
MPDRPAPLSPRHERFVLEFLKDGNATQAYIRAGYSPRGAQPSASRLLRQPHIEAAVVTGQRRVAQALEVGVERVGREYARIAFANIDDYIQVEADGRPRIDLEKASRAQRAGIVELKIANHSKPEQTVTLRLGKLRALDALTRRIALFGKQPEPAPPSADRARYEAVIAKLREDLADRMNRLEQAEAERDAALAALASGRDVSPSPSGPSAAPDLRGEKENPPPDLPQPPPRVAGPAPGKTLWNTARQPRLGPAWHDTMPDAHAGSMANHSIVDDRPVRGPPSSPSSSTQRTLALTCESQGVHCAASVRSPR